MRQLRKFCIKCLFSDGQEVKYVVSMESYNQASNEAKILQSELAGDEVYIKSFMIQEIKS